MELFSLLAKLTLDDKEFDKGLDEAEQKAAQIGDIEPSLELDNRDFNENIEESQGLGDTFGDEMEKVFKGIKTALTVTGIVGAIAGIVNGLKEAVNMTAETADGIDKGSKRLGISRQAYQEWDHALKQSGSSIDDVKKGLMNMQLALQAADPKTMFKDAEDQVDGLADAAVGLSADAYEALRDLGLLERLQAQEFSNAEELMDASLKALAAYDGSTDDRGVLVRKLFGKGGDNLNALLDEGVDGVEALLKEAGNLGLIMSDEEIDNAVKYGDAVANLNAELDAIRQAFVADIIPVLTDAVSWLTDFLTLLNPRLQESSIYQVFDQIDDKSRKASASVDASTATAKALIEDLKEMGDYWSLDEQGRMTWDALAAKALELFPQLSNYIDTDGKKIDGNTKAIEDNIDAWARLEKQRILSNAMAEKTQKVADDLTAAYEKGTEASLKMDEAEGKRANAITQVNEALKKNEELRSAVLGAFGVTELNNENATDILSFIRDNGFQTANMTALDEYVELKGEAEALRTESEEMIEKAKEAQDQLHDYQKKLGEQMGLTTADIIKAEDSAKAYSATLNGIPKKVVTKFLLEEERYHSHAIGSAYVPYDNYPAILHRGERILTASENRRDSGGADLSGLEDRIESAIRSGMANATVRSYLNGRDITEEVNRNNIRDVKGRRFAP